MEKMSKIQVLKAYFGWGNNHDGREAFDVTAETQKICDNPDKDGVRILVACETFGKMPDPAPGTRKTLFVRYTITGRVSNVITRLGSDGQTLFIPNPNEKHPILQVASAVYGTTSESYDITREFANYLSLNPHINSIRIDGKEFKDLFTYGSDINQGTNKSFFLELIDLETGKHAYFCGNDGTTVTWKF